MYTLAILLQKLQDDSFAQDFSLLGMKLGEIVIFYNLMNITILSIEIIRNLFIDKYFSL